ncbi:MAG: hypothetical protein IT174_10795 [Acidobacteria bacterium]|nr:hypothetical protein [Acidobacteriota bacterium]
MNDLDKQIRLAIKPAIKTPYATASVYVWNVLSHRLDEWPGLLRTTDFASSQKTHGWIIKRVEGSSTWKNTVRDRPVWTYDLWGFYGFRSGKESDNSDLEWSEVWDTVYENLKAAPNLGLDGVVEHHELLQLANNTTIDCGEETLHFSHGRLVVHLCC